MVQKTFAPVDMVNYPMYFTRFYTSQVVVWDFFHHQYSHIAKHIISNNSSLEDTGFPHIFRLLTLQKAVMKARGRHRATVATAGGGRATAGDGIHNNQEVVAIFLVPVWRLFHNWYIDILFCILFFDFCKFFVRYWFAMCVLCRIIKIPNMSSSIPYPSNLRTWRLMNIYCIFWFPKMNPIFTS